MEKNTNSIITCYVGLTIVSPHPLTIVNSYRSRVHQVFGVEHEDIEEVHITLIPPFHTTYEKASLINLGIGLATLREDSITEQKFFMHGLSTMRFEGNDIIHFPIQGYNKNFIQKVEEYRSNLKNFGIEMRQPVPSNYTPHITVFSKKEGAENPRLRKIFVDSNSSPSTYFRSTYPTLYAKYKNGYKALSDNPNES